MIFKIEFDEQVWARILDMLATHPYRDVGPIIAAIAQQIQDQRTDHVPQATHASNGGLRPD